MTLTPSALQQGVTRDDLDHAMSHALATIALGNGPTRILVIGPDPDGRPIEATGVIRGEDVLFVHAARMREAYLPLLERAAKQQGAATAIPDPADLDHWSVDGIALTDDALAAVREQALGGHDMGVLLRRLRPGRPAPLAVGTVFRVELDPETFTVLSDTADEQGIALAEVIRQRLRSAIQESPFLPAGPSAGD